MGLGMWYVVCGMWYVVCGMWYVVCGMCRMVYIPHTTYHIPHTTYHIPHTTYHIPRCIALNIHGKTEHVQPAVLYNYNLCGLCWKIFLNILVLNIHGKTEHIGRNLNVKIVTRLLILVKNIFQQSPQKL